MKKRFFDILAIIISLVMQILELLPSGVVLYFSRVTETGEIDKAPSYYSYFDMMPFGNAHFTPLIIGFLTILLLILTLLKPFVKEVIKITNVMIVVSLTILFLSIVPILFGMGITIINIVIIVLISILTIQFIYQKYNFNKKNV